jgi:hypothetical protein
MNHKQYCLASSADGMPALFAIDYPVFTQDQIRISEGQRSRFKNNACVLLLI